MSAPLTEQQKLIHFLNRTSFGPRREDVEKIQRLGIRAYLDEQLHPERITDNIVEEKIAGLKTMRLSSRELTDLYTTPQQAKQRLAQNPEMTPRQDMMQGPRVVILELQQARLLRAVYSQRQLYEVMSDFWSNHFNIFAAKGADRWLSTAYDRDTIRPRALGRFKDLLLATAQSPAMLFYLDNWLSASPNAPVARFAPANRRRGLNENYARELMELHTLGVEGGYTQKDVQEVARCFTGWSIVQPRRGGEFTFRSFMHDDGEKTVLGHKIPAGGGMKDGEMVIDILTHHPSTAKFISTKLVRRFVSDTPPPALVDRVTQVYLKSDGDIREMLRTIFPSPEFYSKESYVAKIKSPFELAVSAIRAVGADVSNTLMVTQFISKMGQPLYRYQPPTGFPDKAEQWVNTGALLERLNFGLALSANKLRSE